MLVAVRAGSTLRASPFVLSPSPLNLCTVARPELPDDCGSATDSDGKSFAEGVGEGRPQGRKAVGRRKTGPLRGGDRLGKYRIVRRIGEGGFAWVYEALDKIEGTHVALKVPSAEFVSRANLEKFLPEVRTHAALDHPNILPIKNADLIGELFVIAVPLASESLADRMRKRMSVETFMGYARQMLEAVAHAHQHRVIHCDLKPENFLLFDSDRLRLADFGIARVAWRTVQGSGSGTVGYIAPEQAMGKPSFRSDVFSLGLILWEMLAGQLPEYPFDLPLPGTDRLRRKVPREFIDFLLRALQVDPRRRFADAEPMLAAFGRLEAKVRRFARGEKTRRNPTRQPAATTRDWRAVRFKQFLAAHRHELALDRACRKCGGPMSEPMQCCPWCGVEADAKRCESKFPERCPRCHRGRKLDWKFCAWCHGKGFAEVAERSYTDVRYAGRCDHCRGQLMPFSRYCPWCRRKPSRVWKITGVKDTCGRCGWGVVSDSWSVCPWCSAGLG